MQIKYPYLLLLLFSLYTLLLTIKINGEKLRRPITFSDFMSTLGTSSKNIFLYFPSTLTVYLVLLFHGCNAKKQIFLDLT